jgi:2-succinyl-5-enolpyruvyl-6-hydroxy-3-cyclohexene-1-carboxylate synthase
MKLNQHISELGPLLKSRGIRHVLITPGSRNAPLIQLFTKGKNFVPRSLVDERSAGYVALGMARELNEPVLLVCTSGTAVLNLSPAVAEAFHQCIPLVILSADRPREKISQFNNQVINQNAPYFNHSKGFFEMPFELRTESELKQALRSVGLLLDEALGPDAGPVHVNVPLLEPLYELLPEPLHLYQLPPRTTFGEEACGVFDGDLSSRKILLMLGMGNYDQEVEQVLGDLSSRYELVAITENISNLRSEHGISNPELVLAGASTSELETLAPDLLISFGGQVVSKRLRLFMDSLEDLERLEIQGEATKAIQTLFSKQANGNVNKQNHFLESWKTIEKREANRAFNYTTQAPFSNLTAIQKVLSMAPAPCTVHLGNSSVIRYSQLFPAREGMRYFSNRGTSGIDGSVSAAVGAASVSEGLHLLIVGDLSFVYDSNALWNKDFPSNLKIVVMNDGGGGIFRLLEGPDRMDFFEEFSVTHHPVSLELLSLSFGREFRRADKMDDVIRDVEALFDPGSALSIVEIDTTKSENSRIFKEFFNQNI